MVNFRRNQPRQNIDVVPQKRRQETRYSQENHPERSLICHTIMKGLCEIVVPIMKHSLICGGNAQDGRIYARNMSALYFFTRLGHQLSATLGSARSKIALKFPEYKA